MAFCLAMSVVAVLVLTQMSRLPVSRASSAVVSAATAGDFSGESASEFPNVAGQGLTFGDVQSVTVNALVVNGASDISSFVNPEGTSFSVASTMKPGESYQMHLALNNTSKTTQVTELVVDMPKSLSVEVDVPINQSATFDVEQISSNRWTIITAPAGEGQDAFFDLVISAYAFRYMNYSQSLTHFELRKPYEHSGDSQSSETLY